MTTSTPIEPRPDGPPPATADDPALMPLRTFFDLLAAPARRYAISYLRRHEGESDLHDLISHATAWAIGAPRESIHPEEYEAAYVEFVKTHLPRLRDAGVIEYELRDERVRFTPAAAAVFDRFAVTDPA